MGVNRYLVFLNLCLLTGTGTIRADTADGGGVTTKSANLSTEHSTDHTTFAELTTVSTPPPASRPAFPDSAQLLAWTEAVMAESSLGRGEECLIKIHAWLSVNLPDVYPRSLIGYLAYCRCWLKLCGILGYKLKDDEEDIIDGLDKEFVQKKFYEHLDRNIPTITLYSIAFLAGVIGNLLVIITVVHYLPRDNITNIFITSLSTADLMVCVICIPGRVVRIVYDRWVLGTIVCYITSVWYFVGLAASALNLTAMGLERYLAIVFPMKAQVMNSPRRARKTVVVLWLIAVIMSIPSYRIVDTANRGCAHKRFHADSKKYYIFLFVAVFMVPLLTLGYVYTHTSITLWKSIKTSAAMKSRSLSTSSQGEDNEAKRRLKVIYMLIVVVIVFAICWCPMLAYNIFYFDGIGDWLKDAGIVHNDFYPFLELVTYVNSCLNPILYAFVSEQFRKGFKRCLRKVHDALRNSVSWSGGCNKAGISSSSASATATTRT